MSDKPHFKTRARLLTQLGDQLIKNESVALLELVKNSYDADSPDCNVYFENPDDSCKGKIIIEDHGEGMNRDLLENVWLEIGTSNKFDKKQEKYRTPKYNRRPLGEKGIGRFGAHRLGNYIEIITKKENEKECILIIDWNKINDSKYMEDFPVELVEHDEPEYFIHTTGTKIIISNLKTNWTRGTLRNLARAVYSLNSPFISDNSFKTNFVTNNNWLEGILTFDEIRDKALYNFEVTIIGNFIVGFSYDFVPYKALSKLEEHHINTEDIKIYSRIVTAKNDDIDLSKYKIGKVRIRGMIFDLDTKVLNLGISSGKEDIKKYLRENGGVQVFRDNMRIFDYGEPGNDWLDLDSERVNRPSFKLSNGLILGAVYLDGEDSLDLIEKANREGFIENAAFNEFKAACKYAINKVEFFRNQDKEKLRRMYFVQTKREIPVQDVVSEIREIVGNSNIDNQNREIINQKLTGVSNDFTRITDNLLKSAGAGLNLGSVLHQIEKIANNLLSYVKNNLNDKTLLDMINILVDLISGYTSLIKNSDAKLQSLSKLIEESLKSFQFRFICHNIKIIEQYKGNQSLGFCSKHLFINCIMNVLDNSIWWLNYSKRESPQIFIDIQINEDNYISVIIADNGPGFGLLTSDELVTPFMTTKPEGAGMGIGLHLTNEMMKSIDGRLIFPEPTAVSIPEDFKNGAIVELQFKR